MSTKLDTCQNCEQQYENGFKFCPHCGQKTNDELTLGVLFYNTISNYFSFDARFLKSFIPLMLKPGFLAKAFINGKRLLYLHPAQMYLFISVIFFFIFSFTARKQSDVINKELKKTLNSDVAEVKESIKDYKKDSIKDIKDKQLIEINKALREETNDEVENTTSTEKSSKGINTSFDFNQIEIDSLINANVSDDDIYRHMGLNDDDGWLTQKFYEKSLKFYKSREGGSILKAFYDTIPIAMFFLLPLFALLIKLLYYNKGQYAHHLVFSFYFFSFLFTVFSFIFGINYIWDIPDGIDWLIALSTFVYLMIALKRFYGQGWFLTWFKCCVVSFTFLAFVTPLAATFLFLFAFLIY
ncbi:hypothetical protein BWZ20_02220 [Winogradskyella sp. J14-2]|uniref:DUF3667 domain-containing protein n=1 Tax=Winogradskyella sp. J14-2 TaxID=1936080 RepID=UPI000972858C|nr:DUF3667 domain-containing protein [Winogradskyella sp. J14-2]APY07190.1 hypothetical protein BWZ20_02220 [Winogradskyella sp. J14-2]